MNKLISLAMIAAASALFAAGCKGKTEVKPDPETVKQLNICQTAIKDKDQYIKDLNARLAQLKTNGSSGDEIVVRFDGPPWKITNITGNSRSGGNSGAKRTPVDNATFASLSNAFIRKVNLSRGAIKRCYNQALKKDTGLQARTINLKIQVRYSSSGKVVNASFAPRVSSGFSRCMSSVTKRWNIPKAPPQGITLHFPNLTLTPS